MTDQTVLASRTTYYIQSRPHPGAPWQRPTGTAVTCGSKDTAREELARRRHLQSTWQHRLMARTTTVTEQPAKED